MTQHKLKFDNELRKPYALEIRKQIDKRLTIDMGRMFEYSLAFDECVKQGWLPADYHLKSK